MNPIPDPAPRRILIRGVNWLGDAVMTTPALSRLRARWPQAHISLLTDQKLAELWQRQRCVDRVLTFIRGESPWQIGRRLRPESFDVVLVFPNSTRSALEVWAAGIPRRIGHGGGWRRWLLNKIVPERPGTIRMRKRSAREIRRLVAGQPAVPAATASSVAAGSAHQIHQYLWLTGALGAETAPCPPRLDVSAEELAAARARWLKNSDPVLLAVNPGAAYGPAKRWPLESFGEVVREVSRAIPGVHWVVVGGGEERQLGEDLASEGVKLVNAAGETSLRELMALLRLCRVLVTNDSGPMHVAAALGTHVVAPFGSTSPELTGPGLPRGNSHVLLKSSVSCAPCFRRECPIDFRCMKGIGAAQVTRAVLGLLAAG